MKSESGEKRSKHWYLLKASQETNVHRGLETAVPDKLLSLESVSMSQSLRQDTQSLLFSGSQTQL